MLQLGAQAARAEQKASMHADVANQAKMEKEEASSSRAAADAD